MNASGKYLRSLTSAPWGRAKAYFGFGETETYLWPRWILLRAVGVVFIIVFAGIITESNALIGPDGIVPLPDAMAQLRSANSGLLDAVLESPTLFWISSHPLMPVLIQWLGLFAGVALLLNLWPRMALFVCWITLLSFVRGWVFFSGPLVDRLMLEVSLLCIPFAPAGYRPGLGAQSSPRPFVTFMIRWLLFRVMFENGISKLISGDLHWLNFTAMDVLYETAPSPTILGYLDHQMPHFWHMGEYILTFAAEIGAPILAIFGGARSRWLAFGLWVALQAGIQLTCNFGWLNTASIGLGLLLLNDKMLASAASLFRASKLSRWLVETTTRYAVPPLVKWRRYGLNLALSIHFYLGFVVFASVAGVQNFGVLNFVNRPLNYLFSGLGSVNAYSLFSYLEPFHFVAEFLGSNDGGVTWRPYEFRYFPQQLDRISPFTAPWFCRFEANLQVSASKHENAAPLYLFVATRLLEQKKPVLDLFERNPFADRPATMIRVAGYQYTFTDYETHRATGNYWHRTYLGEYQQMAYIGPAGEIAQVASDLDQVHVKAFYGNLEAQSHLGFLYISGEQGVARDGAKAAKWFLLAAHQGQPFAQLNLAVLLNNGDGVPQDGAQALHWCRQAAEQGLADAQDLLGIMYMRGDGGTINESEGLVWFEVAALAGHRDGTRHRDMSISRMHPTAVGPALLRAKNIFSEIKAKQTEGGGK